MKDIKTQVLRFLTRREHSRLELRRKLLLKHFSPELIDEVLDEVAKDNWQNDERYTQSYIRMRRQQGYGPVRIAQELQERGISAEVFSALLEENAAIWQESLWQLCRKKWQGKLANDFVERAKQFRFLQYRGFSIEQIKKVFEFNYENE